MERGDGEGHAEAGRGPIAGDGGIRRAGTIAASEKEDVRSPRAKEEANALAALRFQAPEAYRHYTDSPYLRERNEILLQRLPGEARTVLDVGCGPGIVGHPLEASGRFVVSTDLSRPALEARPPRPYLASATDLPHADRSFDLVLSLEMLEHIPDETLTPIANEMSRLADRWILVGVPHRENLARNRILCPRCGHRFNRTGHVQSFDEDRLAGLFPQFTLSWTHVCGPPVRDYPSSLLRLRHDVAGRYSEMAGAGANICPECGQTEFPAFRHNLLSFALDGVNKLISRRRPYWILELLERRPDA